MWVLGNQPSHDGDDGIIGICNAKQNFIARIVESECRSQRIRDEILDSAHGPQDAYAIRFIRRQYLSLVIAQPSNDGRDASEVQGRRGGTEYASKENQPVHPIVVIGACDGPMTTSAANLPCITILE